MRVLAFTTFTAQLSRPFDLSLAFVPSAALKIAENFGCPTFALGPFAPRHFLVRHLVFPKSYPGTFPPETFPSFPNTPGHLISRNFQMT